MQYSGSTIGSIRATQHLVPRVKYIQFYLCRWWLTSCNYFPFVLISAKCQSPSMLAGGIINVTTYDGVLGIRSSMGSYLYPLSTPNSFYTTLRASHLICMKYQQTKTLCIYYVDNITCFGVYKNGLWLLPSNSAGKRDLQRTDCRTDTFRSQRKGRQGNIFYQK